MTGVQTCALPILMLRVELESGEIKEFNYSDVTKVGDFSSTETEDGNEKE